MLRDMAWSEFQWLTNFRKKRHERKEMTGRQVFSTILIPMLGAMAMWYLYQDVL